MPPRHKQSSTDRGAADGDLPKQPSLGRVSSSENAEFVEKQCVRLLGEFRWAPSGWMSVGARAPAGM